MTNDQWQRIESLLQEALDLPLPERRTFLDKVSYEDADLSHEVSSLAAAFDEYRDFMEEPALVSDAEVLFSFSDKNVGQEIGPYKIERLLGFGGMGEVYLAKDQRLDRLVALKILPAYLSDESRLNRFHKEARAASALNHPNIITIHEVGEGENVHFIATEFIEGETLRELLEHNELTLAQTLDTAKQVCEALVAAHAAGIIHRDIKPENIMRRPDGIVKLLDFGIAKLTETGSEGALLTSTQTEVGSMLGTVSYMSPEQARGLAVDERSDIWSLGVVIYEMVTNHLPFSASTRLDTLVAILERNPDPITNVPAIQPIIDKCLAKDAATRYQRANELLSALSLVHLEVDSSQSTLGPFEQARRRQLILAIMIALLVLASSVFVYRRIAHRSVPASAAVSAPKLYSLMTEQEKLVFIDKQEQRISTLMGEHPVGLNADALQSIKRQIDRYLARANNPNSDPLPVVFARARPYLPTIGRSFKERNVPVILGVYLPMIESEYQVCFENVNGSKGLYQFMPGTAELYGVRRDEMCDPEKMTPAAAHYLADRMAELGDDAPSLTLVLLSYTTGAEWVRSTLRGLRDSGNYDRNFWTMFAQRQALGRQFQNEIAHYVPRFFAAAIIGENPEAFGFDFAPLTATAGG